MKDATFRFTEAFLHEDRWTKLMSLDLACWQFCESSAPSSSSLFPQCLVCVFLLVSWIIQREKGKRSYRTHTLVWMCSFAFAKSAWGQGGAAHSGTGEALVLPNFFFLPLHRGPDWERAQRHFGTFCATWWNFIGSKLSGVWVTRQRGTHLSHFLAAQYFSPKCRIPYCAQQFNCARPIIKFFFLNVKISL